MKTLLANLTRKPRYLWRLHVLPWYQRLQQREQRLVLATSVALPLLIIVFGLWLPLHDDAKQIRSVMPELQAQLSEAQLLADKVVKGGVKSAAQSDLLTVVDAAARGSNIRQFITRIKPQPGTSGQSVLVQLRKAPYNDTVRFFSQMANQGVATERAKLSDVEANGLVDVDITFSSN